MVILCKKRDFWYVLVTLVEVCQNFHCCKNPKKIWFSWFFDMSPGTYFKGNQETLEFNIFQIQLFQENFLILLIEGSIKKTIKEERFAFAPFFTPFWVALHWSSPLSLVKLNTKDPSLLQISTSYMFWNLHKK